MVDHPSQNEPVEFSRRPISITLTGARWFALLAGAAGKPLSAVGRLEREAALTEISAVLIAANKA